MGPKKFTWEVGLMREDGERIDVTVRAFWSPDHPTTREGVLDAARVETWWAFLSDGVKNPETGKPFKFMPTGDPVLV